MGDRPVPGREGRVPPDVVPDLEPLGLPDPEEALLRLVLVTGRTTTPDAAASLGTSSAQVSRAAAGLKRRGFLLEGLDRGWGLVLAPLDAVLERLVVARREQAAAGIERLEATRDAILATARWAPARACPHTLVSRDLREWERIVELRRVQSSLDVVVDRHHVNHHVPGGLLDLDKPLRPVAVRLLVTGVTDDRPMVVLPTATDLDASRAGIEVRRLARRCAAFSVYDDRRVEVPLWRLEASGWSEEPGEVWAAARLFGVLWAEADPWPGAAEVPSGRQSPLQSWPPAGPGAGTVGSVG